MVVGRPDDEGMTLLRSKVGRGAGGDDALMDVGVKDGEQVALMKRMGMWAFVRKAGGDAEHSEGWLLHEYLHEITGKEEEGGGDDDTPELPPAAGEVAASPVHASEGQEGGEGVNTPIKGKDTAAPRDTAADADGDPDAEDEDGETRYVKGPGLQSVQGRWAQLVIRCARALKRSAKNLPVYVSEGAIKLQLAVLGDEAVGKILALGEVAKERELTEEESKYVVETLAKGIKHSSLSSQNGAKAALNAVKYIAGASRVAGSSGGVRKPKKPKGPTVSMSCSAGAAAAAEGVAANLSAKFLQNVHNSTDDPSDADTAVDPADEPALGWLTGRTVTRPPRTARADEKWDIEEVIEKPSFDDINAALDSVTIPVNLTRFNVKKSQDQEVTGMCLGVVNARSNGVVASSFGRNRPNLTKTLVNFAKLAVPDFNFTSIQVNKNYLSAMHVDKNNLGPSYIVGVGDYTQGGLWVQTLGAVDCNRKWILFDGNVPHCTLPYTGTRYTLIYFAQQSFSRLGAYRPHGDDKQWMAQCGFPMPPKNARKLEYEPAVLRLKNAKAAFRKWQDCVEKGIDFDWNDQEVKTWERPEDDVERRTPTKRSAARSKLSADLWSDSDSDDEVDEEVGTGWTWYIKGRGAEPFAGKPIPKKFLKRLGRTGGGRQLAGNLLRQELGLIPALRERKRVRRYMDDHSDDDMDDFSEDDEENSKDTTRKKHGRDRGTRRRRRRREERDNELPSWMQGVVANQVRGHAAKEDETPAEIAASLNVDVRQLVYLSKQWYPSIHANCKLLLGTLVLVPDTPGALPGNYVFPVEELPEEENDEAEPVGTWYQRRIVDKHTPVLSRSELRRLAVSAGVVSYRWADKALKLSERRRAAAARKREAKLSSLEPTLVSYYSSPAEAMDAPQIASFYSRKALAKRKGVPMSALQPAKRPKLEKKNAKKGKTEPARPTNAYVFFLKSARASVATANPGAGSGGITKMCAAMWKALSPEERAPFDEQAAADSLRYKNEMEQWKKDHPVETDETTDTEDTVARLPPITEQAPEGWTIELDAKRNEHYYWHEDTLTSSWTHPVTGKFPDGSEPAVSQLEDSDGSDSSVDEDAEADRMDTDEAAAALPAAAPSPAPPAKLTWS